MKGKKNKIAVTLAGGGARGAYQAGVLRAIYEICKAKECPFGIISGVSAGSINGVALAAGADDFDEATKLIWDTWQDLQIDKIFKTDAVTLAKIGSAWAINLTMGHILDREISTHLLDTSPLKKLLRAKIDMERVKSNLHHGLLHGVALSATDYHTGKSVTFFDGDRDIKEWDLNSGIGRRCSMKIDHIMASSAIPIFFPPVRVEKSVYGDGGIALRSPLSPAIHLGAERILIIGLEHPLEDEPSESCHREEQIMMGDIIGTLLNALFLNSIVSDVARMDETNNVVSIFNPEQLKSRKNHLRKLPFLFIRPSQDLAEIDQDQFNRFPFTLRHLLKGVGINSKKGWDFLGYLAFDRIYASKLLELGYKDGWKQKEKILEFFAGDEIYDEGGITDQPPPVH